MLENYSYKVGDMFFCINEDRNEIATIVQRANDVLSLDIVYFVGTKKQHGANYKFNPDGAIFSRFKNNPVTPLIKELL